MRQFRCHRAAPPGAKVGGTVTLKPGSYHLMFAGLKAPVEFAGAVEIDLPRQRPANFVLT